MDDPQAAAAVEPPTWHLARVEGSAELVYAVACRACGAGPRVLSIFPGTGLPRAVEQRHEPGCPENVDG